MSYKIARYIHWASAIIVSFMLLSQFFFSITNVFYSHIFFGITLFFLTLTRIYRMVNRFIKASNKLRFIKKNILYAIIMLLLITMPITGYLMINSGGNSVYIFNILQLPNLISTNLDIKPLLHNMHEIIPYILIIGIITHIILVSKKNKSN